MNPVLRFSGHETFPCRYAWLPKAAQAVNEEGDQDILTAAREDDAMVKLGVGKNMVRSIRFWAECSDVIEPVEHGHKLTEFGRQILVGTSKVPPLDPYLEDIQTLWLIHWKLATNRKSLIFAWDFLLSQFQEPDLYPSNVQRAFRKTIDKVGARDATPGSLEQLYHVFLHSYVPTRGDKGDVREDNLDCPLVELELLQPAGFTQSETTSNRLEPKYAFRREDKNEIGHRLFAFCLDEFWRNSSDAGHQERSVSFHSVVNGRGSPGQVFKLPEPDIRNRLTAIDRYSDGVFRFDESAAIPRVVRQAPPECKVSLDPIYDSEVAYA
jgi:hypothetical protein